MWRNPSALGAEPRLPKVHWRGEPITGEFAEARKFVTQYQNYCFSLQNDDGSLSTEWFRGPGDEDDIERRLRTTGHQVEWLAYSMPDEKLQYYRMVRTVNYLVNLLSSNPQQEWHNGSRAHARACAGRVRQAALRAVRQPAASRRHGAGNETSAHLCAAASATAPHQRQRPPLSQYHAAPANVSGTITIRLSCATVRLVRQWAPCTCFPLPDKPDSGTPFSSHDRPLNAATIAAPPLWG